MAELLFRSSSNVIVKREAYRDEKPYTGKRIVQNLKLDWDPNPAWNPNAVLTMPTNTQGMSPSQSVAIGYAQHKGTATATWTVPFSDYDFVLLQLKGSKDNGKTWYNVTPRENRVFSIRYKQINSPSSISSDPFKATWPIKDNIQYLKVEATPVSVGGGYHKLGILGNFTAVSQSGWQGEKVVSNVVTCGTASTRKSSSGSGTASDQDKKPSTPTVTIDGYELTAEVNNYRIEDAKLEFELVENDTKVVKTQLCDIILWRSEMKYRVTMGKRYKARVRAKIGDEYSEWSDYCSNVEPGVLYNGKDAYLTIAFDRDTEEFEIKGIRLFPDSTDQINYMVDTKQIIQPQLKDTIIPLYPTLDLNGVESEAEGKKITYSSSTRIVSKPLSNGYYVGMASIYDQRGDFYNSRVIGYEISGGEIKLCEVNPYFVGSDY